MRWETITHTRRSGWYAYTFGATAQTWRSPSGLNASRSTVASSSSCGSAGKRYLRACFLEARQVTIETST